MHEHFIDAKEKTFCKRIYSKIVNLIFVAHLRSCDTILSEAKSNRSKSSLTSRGKQSRNYLRGNLRGGIWSQGSKRFLWECSVALFLSSASELCR